MLCGRKYEIVPQNVEMNMYIYDIEFGFYEKQVEEGVPFDVSIFGVETEEVVAAEFTFQNGVTQTIDIKKFLAVESGMLTLTVKKAGYRTTTLNVKVKPIQIPVVEDNKNDNDVSFIW